MTPAVTLFAGPTLHGADPLLLHRDIDFQPPARRADVDRLVQSSATGVIVLCDGVFHAEPAVSHAELCRALDAGWQVWGVASLGAIRAWELREEGMLGFGYVYSMFERLPDFADDEMCLTYFPEAPYFPVSEALVNIRYALELRRAEWGISDFAAERLVKKLRATYFAYRTLEHVRLTLIQELGVNPVGADAWLSWLRRNPVKSIDLMTLLRQQPWRAHSSNERPDVVG